MPSALDSSDSASLVALLAQAAFYSGDFDQAVEAAEKASIWTEGWRDKGKLEHPAMVDEAQLLLARSHRALGFKKLALESYEQLIKQASEYDSTQQLAEGFTDWGELLVEFGDLEQSASCLEEAARLHNVLGDEAESQRCSGNAQRIREIRAGRN